MHVLSKVGYSYEHGPEGGKTSGSPLHWLTHQRTTCLPVGGEPPTNMHQCLQVCNEALMIFPYVKVFETTLPASSTIFAVQETSI